MDIVNLEFRNASAFAQVAHTGLGRSAWRLPANVLLPIAQNCATAAELSARIGIDANVVAKRLRADNVPPAFIGWERNAAEMALADHLVHSIGGRLSVTSEQR
ncbi:hypothetical protein HRV97_17150 [Sphingomonas sp. HHU CXW]|uniref:Uncharacterized protein n=1 Tax=Sphingomonas hominis TaxID=2741495 RepID=A0ABX2JM20_9SPHN|nr:hypothetical protein [Sphingomonas hominis]NTS66864.1 hypothetical protein [Sphingomonas hominis]